MTYRKSETPVDKRKPWIDYIPETSDKVFQVLSYGAGMQTFAALVLILKGKLPKPDLVIFADTQNEHDYTYWHIETVAKPLCQYMGLEFVTVTKTDIYQYCLDNGITPMWPTCTTSFKIQVINTYLFKRFGLKRGKHSIDMWIGITTDEGHRTTPSGVAYVRKVFPLLDLGLSRDDCVNAIIAAGYPPPGKSGCKICPHQNWEKLVITEPEIFKEALALEENAAKRKENVALPEYGRSLRKIILQPKAKYIEFDEACSTGFCHV